MDPSIGINVKFLHDWSLESPFTAFISETDSYPTCWNWNPRLTYHDRLHPGFSFNPYVEFFYEIANKSTIVFNRAASRRGYYGAIGFDPTYAFQTIPLTVEMPTNILLPSGNFYQRANGFGGGNGLGLFTTELKASVPLRFIPRSCVRWRIYAGVQYYYLNNQGLLDGNQFAGAANSRERNLFRFHGGLNVTF